jgi:hypothetical protein
VYEDDAALAEMRQSAMGRSFEWSGAAAEYEALYTRLAGRPVVHEQPRQRPQRRVVRSAAEELQAAA